MPKTRVARIIKALIIALSCLFVFFAASGAYLYSIYQDLPDLGVGAGDVPVAQTSYVYAADGSLIAEWHGEQDRTFVSLEQIPETLQNAVIAVEDERFYQHKGVDIEAIVRAFKANGEEGSIVQGGSTITQQLVKLLSGDDERTLGRKIREALLAYRLEARTEKGRVLETYLNLVYFGHGWYGVEAASRNYFGKDVSQLDLAESATLAAIIRSPGTYSPKIDPEAALERRNLVIGKMEELGYVSGPEAAMAREEPITLAAPAEIPETAPYFVELVKQELIEHLGADAVFNGGLRVYTTLDPGLQKLAEEAAWGALPSEADPEVALVCIDHPTGRVLAMVGGRDFERNQFNLAAQGHRQPGSAFKPFVLVAAMSEGVSPDERFETSPYTVQVSDGTWHVENYEGAFPDSVVTLRDATVYSINAVYARLIIRVGADKVVQTAKQMGIETTIEPNPAIALGGLTQGVTPLEMASAYGTIASGGERHPPVVITKVTDDSGEVVMQPDPQPSRVLAESLAVEVSKILHEVVTRGTGVRADIGEWAAGKTGTTQSYRDAWFVGYSGDLVTSVWVGYPQGQVDMLDVHGRRVSGGTYPAEIWAAFMRKAVREWESAPPPGDTEGGNGG